MNILLLHNEYQQFGGEDAVLAAETELLRNAGHTVRVEKVSNDTLTSPVAKAKALAGTPYDGGRRRWAEALVHESGAEIVHIHNFFPLLSPAVHEGASRAGAAVVQTLHNYRLLCAGAMFLRDGQICEKCLHGSRVWAVAHRCYRGSVPGSLALAAMQARADVSGVWRRHVHAFIALTAFARDKFIEGGLPADRLVVKPNSAPDQGAPAAMERKGALFVGRLSKEKGVDVLLKAWARLPDIPLVVIGDGPERGALEAGAPTNVHFMGHRPPEAVREQMLRAACLVVPSVWYEGFPMTVVEAFSAGLPVIASRIGSLAEIIKPGTSGRLAAPGDAESLAAEVTAFFAGADVTTLSSGARATYDRLYRPEQNLAALEDIYRNAMSMRAAGAIA